MQTTLLGFAIALILALIAALIGPYFIDWNQFRPQFEAEATQIIGAPVKVSGELQARLLPTPTLRLGSVAVGGPNDLGKVRADRLEVEFSLGDLMRGQWRANELSIGGMSLDLGLDRDGRIDWPASNGRFNWASLSIDRLNVTGRAALHDALSRSTLELSDIGFSGDVRSLSGAIRGDGKVTVAGTRYPFRVSSGQTNDGNGTRLHLNIDPGERPVSAELDGVLNFEARAPRFEGALTLAVPPAPKAKANEARTPWKVTTKLKADHNGAQLEQIEASYGSEERALKFSGAGDMRFGASPLLHMALSARQLDIDRLLATDNAADSGVQPVLIWPALRALTADVPHPPLPVRIEASGEQIMLGSRPLQNPSIELHGDATSWAIDRLDLRAPGNTHVGFNGSPSSRTLAGALDIDSADPDVLMAWLQGRSDLSSRGQKSLRLRGNVAVNPDGVVLDRLKAETDSGTLEGRVAFSPAAGNGGPRLDAALRADQLDLDAAAALVRSLAGPQGQWPDEAKLSLDVGRAISAGQEFRPLLASLTYTPKSILLDRLKIGQPGGVTLDGGGHFDRDTLLGSLTVDSTAASMGQISGIVAPFAPSIAARLNAMGTGTDPIRAKLTLNLSRSKAAPAEISALAQLNIDAPQLIKGDATASASLPAQAVRNLDFDALSRSDVNIATKLSAQRSDTLLTLLGIGHVIAAGEGPTQFEASISGKWRMPLHVSTKLTGTAIDADAQGSAEPWAQDAKTDVNLRVRKANLAPLFGLKPSDASAQNISLSSHVSLEGNKLTFDDLDSTSATARLRGHLAVSLGEQREVQGEVGLDALQLAPAFAVAIGAAGHDPAAPLVAGLSKGWRGRITFQALRGELWDGIELRPVSGVIRSDGQSITFDGLKGAIGGGEASATIDARDGANGLVLNASVELRNVDGAALHYRNLKMPASRTSLQMALTTQGRSVSALTGALSGNGTVTLQGASIMGLDPRAFELAIRAGDSGLSIDDAKLRQIVEPALASGALLVASAQIPFTVRDGRLRVGATALEGDGVRAIISGGYDIPADQADIRATLASTAIGSGSSHPEIQLFMAGPPGALTRSVDVTSLSSWLAVRAIDRETRRLDSIERGEPQPQEPATLPPSTAALPLPGRPEPMPSHQSLSDAPLSGHEPPRRIPGMPKTAPPRLPSPPAVSNPAPAVSQQVAPLPPPIDVRPPPGPPPLPVKPKPRPPLVLTPPAITNP
ncbi:AsmA family protein [Bradyrhizobium sp. STM 3562]|uniref:AsmA family protein n=1 Tax=Bradyrhizobium sp. STM 3562 TaxID=578924 RepID=UPI00388D102D